MAHRFGDFADVIAVTAAADAVVLLVVMTVLFVSLRIQWRRALRRFFGVAPTTSGRIAIKLSNIWVKPSGTVAIEPSTSGFSGYAITEPEYHYALRVVQSIQSRGFTRLLLAVSEHLLGKTIEPPVVCHISPGPRYIVEDNAGVPAALDDQSLVQEALNSGMTLICVGSPLYNGLTGHVLANAHEDAHFRFIRTELSDGSFCRGIEVRDFSPGRSRPYLRETEELSDGKMLFRELFIVQRLVCPGAEDKTVFLCAGTSTAATVAALLELTNWKRLYREFGSQPFGILYELETTSTELSHDDHSDLPEGWHVHRLWHTNEGERRSE